MDACDIRDYRQRIALDGPHADGQRGKWQESSPTHSAGPRHGSKRGAGKKQRGKQQPPDPTRVRMTGLAYDKLRLSVGQLRPERGGIFVSRQGAHLIEDFIFDDASDHVRSVYYPNAKYLNGILERQYEPFGFFFVGVGHSHPGGMWRPSGDAGWGDVKAARNNLLSDGNPNLDALFIPIIESADTTGVFRIHPFIMLKEDLRVHPATVEIID